MTPTVAILALAVGAAPLPATSPPLQLVTDHERIALRIPRDAVTVEAQPFERRLVVRVPQARVQEVAGRLRATSRLCRRVDATRGAVILGCAPRVRASVDDRAGQATLDLRLLSVPAWRPEEEGPPLVPLDTAELLGERCPGITPAVRGECALAEGRLEDARRAFEEDLRHGPSPHASVRLGDLALADDHPELAVKLWRAARGEPRWGRLAAARLCELEPRCLDASDRVAVLDPGTVQPVLRPDVTIRTIRLRALDGDLPGAARAVAAESRPGGACQTVLAWCRRLLLLALESPLPGGAEALAAWLETPGRGEGPLARELLHAAVRQAQATGAPSFAARLLAAEVGRTQRAELSPHLLWTAHLFLAGNDRARAEEVVLFAETRLTPSEWADRGWVTLRRTLRRAPTAAPRTDTDPPDLAAAKAALESARLAGLRAR